MNEQETAAFQEISKKELLLKTGISYGQLYRWKREGLIPEDWFEKRSSFTGQETFFPRKLILERVEAIQSMKDGLSLSEIRDMLNAVARQTDLRQTLLETGSMSEDFIDSLDVVLEGFWMSELSLKAVVTLHSALDKAGASREGQGELVAQAIKALSVEVPVLPDNSEAGLQQEEAPAPDNADAEADDAETTTDETASNEEAGNDADTAEATTAAEEG